MHAAAAAALSEAEAKAEVAPFLRNLRKMLDVESDEVLRWTPDGRAFEIHDMERMMESVLPKYFKHRKYTSFQRQLNYFNFKKWTKSKAVVCTFSNEHFVRDRPELAWRITRKKSVPSASPTVKAAAAAAAATHGAKSRPRAPPRSLSLPSYSPAWKQPQDAELRVLHVKREPAADFAGFAHAATAAHSFPSPTDVDAMYDSATMAPPPPRYYSPPAMASPTLAGPAPAAAGSFMAAATEPESLEWIDNFLPSLDARMADDPLQQPAHAYMGSMMAALLRPTPPHYMLPAAGPPAADSFMCLATM